MQMRLTFGLDSLCDCDYITLELPDVKGGKLKKVGVALDRAVSIHQSLQST